MSFCYINQDNQSTSLLHSSALDGCRLIWTKKYPAEKSSSVAFKNNNLTTTIYPQFVTVNFVTLLLAWSGLPLPDIVIGAEVFLCITESKGG